MNRILIISVILLTVLLSACSTAYTPPSSARASNDTYNRMYLEAPTPLPKRWEGSGTRMTERFTVNSTPWAVQWTNNPNPQPMAIGQSMGTLQIYVYDAQNRNNPKLVSLCADVTENATGTCYINETGTFYLMITGFNTYWEVKASPF